MKLINDISDLATIEAGYMVLETARIEVFEMLQAVLSLTRERACGRNLSLELRCPPDVGTIVADERRLKQALFNLISDAIKFTLPGGAITLRAERRETELLLTVADTGIGHLQSDQAHMLHQLERSTRQSDAGFGLSLVKRLIELHGGSIGIESATGCGTRIVCRLPITQRDIASTDLRLRGPAPATEREAGDGCGSPPANIDRRIPGRTRAAA